MIPYPAINPVALSLGPLQIKWYGIAYVVGLLLGYQYGVFFILKRLPNYFKDNKQFLDLAVGALLSMVVGGRIGHIVFYEPEKYLELFYIWKGGMSFHGALIGSIIYGIYKSRQLNIPFLYLADVFAACTPVALFLGRIANFINGELVGRETNVPWAMIFPGYITPRHPSQLYEALTEGLLLLIILNICHKFETIRLKQGIIFSMFIAGYGVFRTFCEEFRDPDFFWMGLTSGQLYSLPMILFGTILGVTLWRSKKS